MASDSPLQSASSQTNSPPQVPDYDPAYDTLLFDILAVLSTIDWAMPLCKPCKHSALRTAQRALDTLLDKTKYEDMAARSHVLRASLHTNDTSRFLACTTTANPTIARAVTNADMLRNHLTNFASRDSLIDRLLDALWQDGDDTLNLAQTQLWHCLAGRYTIADAVRGRSLAEFARTHWRLMNNLHRHRQGSASNCTCFGPPLPKGYPFGGDVTKQSKAAVRAAVRHMDWPVARVVDDQLMTPSEWLEEVRGLERAQIPDWTDVLDAMDGMPAFQARMRALGRTEEYRRCERQIETMVEDWRVGGATRVASMPMRVDDVADMRKMLEHFVQQLIGLP